MALLNKLRKGAGITRPYLDSQKSKHVLIVAGEASADQHGSNLVRAIKKIAPEIDFRGIGGTKMADSGVNTLISSSDMAVVGLTEVLSKFNYIVGAYLRLKNILNNTHPDLLILIDYPDFNLRLARVAKKNKIPVLYYISPQIWAWRSRRIKKIARRVDRIAVIFPFEKKFYKERGVEVDFVGHPLLDAAPPELKESPVINGKGFKKDYPVLGLLPGSRGDEVRNLLPLMIESVEILSARYNGLKCILPLASTVSRELVQSIINNSSAYIEISRSDIYKTLARCDMALIASGTATLEAAIMGIPMIIVYKVSTISHMIGKMVIKVPHIGLVNLVAGKEVVPELIQDEVTPAGIVREVIAILDSDRKREGMIKELKVVRERLGGEGASMRTAEIAVKMMGNSRRRLSENSNFFQN